MRQAASRRTADHWLMNALSTIRSEHRAIKAVLHPLMFCVDRIRGDDARPDFELLGSIVHYLDAFCGRLHQPREETYLFPTLCARDPRSRRLIAAVAREHDACSRMIGLVGQALIRYRDQGAVELPGFVGAVQAYAAKHWRLIAFEEDRILPRALARLTSGDWAVVDTEFVRYAHTAGEDREAAYGALLCRIARHAPRLIELDAVVSAAPHVKDALEDRIGSSPYSTHGGMTEPAAKPGSILAAVLGRTR